MAKNKEQVVPVKKEGIGRAATGVQGFDDLVQGGFPRNAAILVAGTPATGKTIFALEFLYHGATQFEEPGIFVTFGYNKQPIIDQAAQFGMDFEALETAGKIKLLTLPVEDVSLDTPLLIRKEAEKIGAKRIVIDSISTLYLTVPFSAAFKSDEAASPVVGESVFRRFIYSFIAKLLEMEGATVLFISETGKDTHYLSRDTISEFVCDGIVQLSFESMGGEFSRSLLVRKMRRTKNDEDIHPLEISNKGIIIHTIQ